MLTTCPRSLASPAQAGSSLAAFGEKIPQERKPSGKGQQEDLLEQCCPPLEALVLLARLHLRLRHQHPSVLGKIHPALLALAAVGLHMLAGGAGISQRGVTARAKLSCFRIRVVALGTLHSAFYLQVGQPDYVEDK